MFCLRNRLDVLVSVHMLASMLYYRIIYAPCLDDYMVASCRPCLIVLGNLCRLSTDNDNYLFQAVHQLLKLLETPDGQVWFPDSHIAPCYKERKCSSKICLNEFLAAACPSWESESMWNGEPALKLPAALNRCSM